MTRTKPSNAVAAYLSSSKNITGSILALGTAAATIPTDVVGGWWPVAVGGLYAVGAAVAPRDKRVQTPSVGASARQVAQLRDDLQDVVDKTDKAADRLPREAYASFRRMVGVLREILAQASKLSNSPDDLFVVSKTIRDYLPTPLRSYLNLPSDIANRPGRDGRSPSDELVAQFRLLEGQLTTMRESYYRGDTQALRTQGRFLEERFHTSSLDLPDSQS